MRLLALVVISASLSPALDLCLQNEAGLDARTLMLTGHYLRQYQGELGTNLKIRCSASAVRVTFSGHAGADHPADALGATRKSNGKILPDMLIFTKALEEMLPGATAESKARALAKVTAHELSHYVHQRSGHKDGLDQPTFDNESLLAFR